MDKQWHYSPDGQEKKGPIPGRELQQLLAAGQLPPTTLVWCEGMANWMPASSVAALQTAPAPAPTPPEPATPAPGAAAFTAHVPQGLTSWMTFVAVMKMIHGIILCLTCVGAIAGVPKIIGAVNFLNAKNLLATMPTVDPAMLPFLEKLRVGFKALGWSIIGLFIMVALVVILEVAIFVMVLPKLNLPH